MIRINSSLDKLSLSHFWNSCQVWQWKILIYKEKISLYRLEIVSSRWPEKVTGLQVHIVNGWFYTVVRDVKRVVTWIYSSSCWRVRETDDLDTVSQLWKSRHVKDYRSASETRFCISTKNNNSPHNLYRKEVKTWINRTI